MTTPAAFFDPLSIDCPTCTAKAGQPCRVRKAAGSYRSREHFQSLAKPGTHLSRVDPDGELRREGAAIRERVMMLRAAWPGHLDDLAELIERGEPDDVELAAIARMERGTFHF
ncbi:zinc finger domain-containing protein [Micromonospora tulbaghiae]|uniref:zinc finger domain-containing protein n=1 Tax=Micromonospora tulbaghiae TaxID=479978 RepID=UPI003EB854F5